MNSGRIYLILGHHRSGTNFISELIQRHPEVDCLSEPLSMHTHFFRDFDLVPWQAESYDQAILHPDLYRTPKVILLLQELRKWLCSAPANTFRGFKETLLFEKLPWLSSFLPGLRVINLVRDPRAIVSSVLNVRDREALWKYSSTVPAYMDRVLRCPENIPNDDAGLCSWSVKARWDLADEHLTRFPATTVRLEDVMDGESGALDGMMSFLGLETSPRQHDFVVESTTGEKGGRYSSYRSRSSVLDTWKNRLTGEQVTRIEGVLGDHIAAHGYA